MFAMANMSMTARSTLTRRSPPTSAPPTSHADAPRSIPPVPAVMPEAKPPDDTPLNIRRPSNKRLRADYMDDSACYEQLLGELSLMKKMLVSCDSQIKLVVRENVTLKKELAEIKVLLHNAVAVKTTKNINVGGAVVDPVPRSTFASVVKTSKVVVINPKTPQKSDVTRKMLKDKLKPSDYSMCGVKNTQTGGVVIECQSSTERNKIVSDATAQLGDKYVVSVPEKRLPRIRVCGLSEQYANNDLITALKKQNPDIMAVNCVINVLHVFDVKSKSRYGAKLEIDAITFKNMMDARKVFVGWDSCMVYEDFNIRRCYKCWGFNHTASKCTASNYKCSKCSGDHQFNECTSAVEKCVACSEAASTMHINLNTNHSATNLSCPTYLHRVEVARRYIKYT